MDAFNAHWVVVHRVADGWASADALVLDERGAASCWAWHRFSLGTDVAGVIYNELRTDVALDPPTPGITFRRTGVKRGRVELERVRHALGLEARRHDRHRRRRLSLAVVGRLLDVRVPATVHRPVDRYRRRRGSGRLATGTAGRWKKWPGRLGGVTWSIGRGAAPPTFGRGPHPDR